MEKRSHEGVVCDDEQCHMRDESRLTESEVSCSHSHPHHAIALREQRGPDDVARRRKKSVHVPSGIDVQVVQLRSAFLAVVFVGHLCLLEDTNASSVLPDAA